MAKPIPKIGSRNNERIGSRKHPRKIPKGVIYVQASFNPLDPYLRGYLFDILLLKKDK